MKRFKQFVNENENKNVNINTVSSLSLQALASLKTAHWASNTLAQHQAYGLAYDAISILVDKFIECSSGKHSVKPNMMDPINDLNTAIVAMEAVSKDSEELSNILEEIKAEKNKLQYLLTLK